MNAPLPKFLMVTTFYPPYSFGGDAVGVQRLSEALARRGHEVTVAHNADAWRILAKRPDPPSPAPVERLRIERIETSRPGLSCLLTQQTGRPMAYARRLRKIIRDGGFEVINFHNISLAGGPGVLSYGQATKIYMAHEHWLVCPSHVLWRHGRELCTGRECVRCVLSYRRPPQLWRATGLLDRKLDEMDAIIAMSRFSRDKHREFGLRQDMEVLPYFLPDAVEKPRLGAQDAPLPHPRPYFLFVGRLERIKGLQDVIPAFRNHPDADLLIAGDGEFGPELRALAAGNDRVRFLGRVGLDELTGYYEGAIALIVPSICFETFGIILIEAFRHGTPVIARRLGPFPEIVEAAGGGLLFDSPHELLEGMRRVQHEAGFREELASRAFDAFQRNWSESVVVPRYLDLVERARARRKGRVAG